MNDTLREIFADWIEESTTEEEYDARMDRVKEYYPDFNF